MGGLGKPMDKLLFKMVRVFAFTGLGGAFLSWVMWYVYYANPSYHSPDKTHGRVYVENMHGVMLYTTNWQHFLLNGAFFISLGIIVLAAMIEQLTKKRRTLRRIA